MTFDDRPFAVRLEELRQIQGLTFRALAARLQECAKPGERGITHGHLANLTSGRFRPTPEVIAIVARAFDLDPASFAEWRLWQAQQIFDPNRPDGFDAAIAALHNIFDGSAGRLIAEPPADRDSRRNARAIVGAAT